MTDETTPDAGTATGAVAVPREMTGTGPLGAGALTTAVVAIVLEIIAISVASSGAWTAGTVLAWLVIALTVVALVGGIVAVVFRRGRATGIAAIVLAILGNPLVLVWLFGVLGAR